jgi:Zn-dependent protease with chaperone function
MSAGAAEAVAAPAEEAVPIPPGVSIANHPRARVSIRRTRARVALIAFGLVLLQAHGAGVPGQESVLRALLAGVAGYLAAWAIGLMLWKQILIAEVRTAHARREARRREARERRAAEAAAAAATPDSPPRF